MEKIKQEGATRIFLPSKALCIHAERAAKYARTDMLGVVRHVNRLISEGKAEDPGSAEVLASAALSVFFRIVVEHCREKEQIDDEALSHYVNVVAHVQARLARELAVSQREGETLQ